MRPTSIPGPRKAAEMHRAMHPPVLSDGTTGCDACGRAWTWKITRQGSEKGVRFSCGRHLRLLSDVLHPDPARHRELVLTREGFWDPVALPFTDPDEVTATHTGANHHQDTGVKDTEMPEGRQYFTTSEPRTGHVPMGVRHPSQSHVRRTTQTPPELGARGK